MPRTTPPTSAPAAAAEPAPEMAVERRWAVRVIKTEAKAVAGLEEQIGPEFHKAVDLLEQCARRGGSVLVTGLGKSGLIGAKISATLASLGVPSHFIHPTEAAHGDLGNFRLHDVCIALSYSGETEEVVTLASVLKQDRIAVISITAGPKAGQGPSGLVRASDVPLYIGPVEDDDRDLSPAPMASTTATLALGDALAECAARRLNAIDDFHRRHPGGSLGALSKPVTEILRFIVGTSLNPIPDDVTLTEALKQSETPPPLRRPGAMLLIDRKSGRLTGLFTDGDLRRVIEKDRTALDRPVREVMTKNPGTLASTALVRDAARMVREFRRDEIPVVDENGKPVGVLDVQDLIAMKLVKE